jgi:hypothetical protein
MLVVRRDDLVASADRERGVEEAQARCRTSCIRSIITRGFWLVAALSR